MKRKIVEREEKRDKPLIRAHGVLNRVAEDGALTGWFRPHQRFSTTRHLIHNIWPPPRNRLPSRP